MVLPTAIPAPGGSGKTITVVVELDSWVTALAEGPGTGALEFSLQLPLDTPVRGALKVLSARFPKLDQALWNEEQRQEMGSHLEVIVNNAILGVTHELES
ncbi:MAG: hypothetical protein OEW39_16850, partial [Deltaproteobacteria bacterium]|nr:hypothetical protein [Deltaproteobacteria bacterium]